MWFFWYMAKKRQWDVRQSIRRASRRLTGRKPEPRKSSANENRRGTVYVKQPPASRRQKPADLESVPESLPTKGWLADEKERSRSRSREDEERDARLKTEPTAGWKGKLGFGHGR
jgi:hypothetical protein